MGKEKYCPYCQTIKSTTEFSTSPGKCDGFDAYCRPCKAIKANKWYKINKKRVLSVRKQDRINNPIKHQKWSRTGYRNLLQKAKSDPNQFKKAAINVIMNQIRGMYKRKFKHITPPLEIRHSISNYLYEQLVKYPYCPYLKIPIMLKDNASVDHIKPLSRFPELMWKLENLQWTSREYNFHKRDKTPQEFYEFCLKVVQAGPQPV